MPLNRQEIVKQLKAHKHEFTEKYPFTRIALFGSYAKNLQTTDSDIDIMVDFDAPVGMEIVDLAMDFEKILGCKVDIVTYNAIKNRLYNYIKNDLIYV